jgi:hypothetical protein
VRNIKNQLNNLDNLSKKTLNIIVWNATRETLYAMPAFLLCFRICHRKTQVNQVGQKLNGTHQLLAYAVGVDLVGDNIGTIMKNTDFN